MASNRLNAVFKSLHIQWQYRPSLATGIGFANENVWSRSARRRQHQQKDRKDRKNINTRERRGSEEAEDDQDEDEDEDEAANLPQLGFKINLSHENGSIGILIRWIIGNDSVIFESFCGMLRNKMMTSTTTMMTTQS